MSWVTAAVKIIEYIDTADAVLEEVPKKLKKLSVPKAPKVFGMDILEALSLLALGALAVIAVIDSWGSKIGNWFMTTLSFSADENDIKYSNYYKEEKTIGLTIGGLVLGHTPYVTGEYGEPRKGHTHQGLDLRATTGTPLYSPFDAKVVRVVSSLDGNIGGRRVLLQTKDGKYGVYLMHLSSVNVKEGDVVEQGQEVGKSGQSGKTETAFAPHLHMEIVEFGNYRKGYRSLDPSTVDLSKYIKTDLGFIGKLNEKIHESLQIALDSHSNVWERIEEEAVHWSKIESEVGYKAFLKQAKSTRVEDVIFKASALKVGSLRSKVLGFINLFSKSLSLKPFQVAGIVGNLWQESGLDEYTNAVGKSGNVVAKGIACWESWAWKKYKQEFGVSMASRNDSFDNQVKFLLEELSSKSKILTLLRSTTNIEQATSVFCTEYERPSKPNLLRRIQLAYSAYMMYTEQFEQSESSVLYINRNRYLYQTINTYLRQ